MTRNSVLSYCKTFQMKSSELMANQIHEMCEMHIFDQDINIASYNIDNTNTWEARI